MKDASWQKVGSGYTRRRQALSLAAGTAGAVLLAACAPQAGGGSGRQDGKTRAPVTLRSWVATPGTETFPATEAADAAIKLKFPHLTVQHEIRPTGSTNTEIVLAAAAASSLPDVIYAQGTEIQNYIVKGIVKPLDAYLARDKDFDLKDFPPVALKMYARDGKQYAVPYDHGPQMVWYNKELFERNGVKAPSPNWTMEDFLDAAKRLTKPADGQWGMAGFTPAGNWVAHGSFLKPWGGSLLNDDETETQIDTKESIDGLEFWARTMLTHKVNPLPAERTALGGTNAMFIQGKAAMLDGGPWTYRSMKAAKITFTADIADWPTGPKGRFSSSMGSGYPISKDSKSPDDAWLYMSEYLGKDLDRSLMGQFLRTGYGIPVRFSLMSRWETSTEFAPPNAKIVAPAEKYSVIGLSISPIKAELDKVMNAAFAPVWQGQTSMPEAAREIRRLAQPLLEQNKKK